MLRGRSPIIYLDTEKRIEFPFYELEITKIQTRIWMLSTSLSETELMIIHYELMRRQLLDWWNFTN